MVLQILFDFLDAASAVEFAQGLLGGLVDVLATTFDLGEPQDVLVVLQGEEACCPS